MSFALLIAAGLDRSKTLQRWINCLVCSALVVVLLIGAWDANIVTYKKQAFLFRGSNGVISKLSIIVFYTTFNIFYKMVSNNNLFFSRFDLGNSLLSHIIRRLWRQLWSWSSITIISSTSSIDSHGQWIDAINHGHVYACDLINHAFCVKIKVITDRERIDT